MDRTLPHFLRFTRALALVSGALVLPACGGAVETGPDDAAAYDGHATGLPPAYDGAVMGTAPYDASAFDGACCGSVAYDGGPVGTPIYDGGPTGIPPVYDGGPVGVAPYDGGPTGTPIYDAGVADANEADVFQGGGPLSPPDLPV